MILRDYQEKAIQQVRASIMRGHRRIVLQLPTGSGKTLIAGAIFQMAREKGSRCAFSVPRISLIDQTVERFSEIGLGNDIGVVQARHALTNISKPIQVLSVQSQMRRDLSLYDLVIIDEAHKQFTYLNQWMAREDFKKVVFVGLSATPWARGMAKHWDDLIIPVTMEELIDAGHLVPLRCYAPTEPDLSRVRTRAGDYREDDLEQVMRRVDLVGDIVNTWQDRGEGRPTFCFCVNRAHARDVQGQFDSAGVPVGYIDYMTPLEERQDIQRQLANGDIKVITSVEALTEGVDIPEMSCVILARPTKSEMLYVQMVGRGLRPSEGKDNLLLLDHSGTALRLGFPQDIIHDELDDGRPKRRQAERREPLPKACPSCAFLKPPRTSTCPSCGFTPTARPDVEVGDGELRELTESPRRRRIPVKDQLAALPPRELYGMLMTVQHRRGYKPGWITANYKNITGRWASDMTKYSSEPLPVSPMLAGWLQSRRIAYAHAKRRDRNDNRGAAA